MKIFKPLITKPFLLTLLSTVVCFKEHDRKLQMDTSQHKVLSHNAFVFCCKLFFFYSRIMVRYIDMKNIGCVKRVSDQCVFLFSTSCELPNFPRFFLFFFFEIYLWRRLCKFACFFFKLFRNLLLTKFCCFEDVYF